MRVAQALVDVVTPLLPGREREPGWSPTLEHRRAAVDFVPTHYSNVESQAFVRPPPNLNPTEPQDFACDK